MCDYTKPIIPICKSYKWKSGRIRYTWKWIGSWWHILRW